jgi:cytochrome c
VLAASAVLLLALSAAAAPAGEPQRGERAYQKCYSCHAVEPGNYDTSGPNLHAIVGRRIAAQRSFDYSPALRALARRHRRWDADLLDRFAADPEKVAPGTTMSFHGMRSPAERRDLLAYLRTLQNAPLRRPRTETTR